MKHLLFIVTGVLLLLNTSCQTKKSKENTSAKILNKGINIINQAIEKHGGELYTNAFYSFDFRGKTYSFKNQGSNYKYTVSSTKDNQKIVDVLENDEFTRIINNQKTTLSTDLNNRYKNGLNSVIYFTLLPYKLNDTAVIKEYRGETIIFDQHFDVIQVTFKQEGGGDDHDDIFYYWIHQEQKTVDFVAYKYHVNGGGIRFRRAFNTRNIDGILFQDYINYSAPTSSCLFELPRKLQENKLKEVSRIEIDNIKNLAH